MKRSFNDWMLSLGVDSFEDHEAAYETVVSELGFDMVRAMLPWSDERLAQWYINKDIPIKEWDSLVCIGNTDIRIVFKETPLVQAVKKHCDSWSLSQLICTLKACATMVAKKHIEKNSNIE